MNKKNAILPIILFAALIICSNVAPAIAATTYSETATFAGQTSIDVANLIPGLTNDNLIRFTFGHFNGGDHGIRDNMALYLYSPVKKAYFPVIWYSDTDQGVAYNTAVMQGAPTIIQQLSPNELQCRGEGKNIIARWSIPLQVPAIPALGTAAFTIPPGHIELKAYGDITSTDVTTQYTWSGYSVRVVSNMQNAEGTFVCPEWQFVGSTVGTTNIRTDYDLTATHP